MLVIRLRRTGRKKTPRFRVVVAERDMPIYGRFVDIIGNVDLQSNPKSVVIDKEKALEWMKKGAQPSDTVARLMVKEGILKKEDLNWGPDKNRKKKADEKKEASEGGDKKAPAEEKKEASQEENKVEETQPEETVVEEASKDEEPVKAEQPKEEPKVEDQPAASQSEAEKPVEEKKEETK